MMICSNCWFYCHTDGKCYQDTRSHYDEVYAWPAIPNECCCAWSPDGLTPEEREDLMTMETER